MKMLFVEALGLDSLLTRIQLNLKVFFKLFLVFQL